MSKNLCVVQHICLQSVLELIICNLQSSCFFKHLKRILNLLLIKVYNNNNMEPAPIHHHKRFRVCKTRLQYRQGRELKAVKIYTVASESRHMLIFGVPKVNLYTNIKEKMQAFGKLQSCSCVTTEMAKRMELEAFTDVFAVHFDRLDHARRAKKQLDAKPFFGGILHISYAPEKEVLFELRDKFLRRQKDVNYRIQRNIAEQSHSKPKNA